MSHNLDSSDNEPQLEWCAGCEFPNNLCQCATIANDVAVAAQPTEEEASSVSDSTEATDPALTLTEQDRAKDSNGDEEKPSLLVAQGWRKLVLSVAFYIACLAMAIYGQVLVMVHPTLIGAPLYLAIAIATVLEVAAIKLALGAAERRRAGEYALIAVALSYAVATVAVGVNVVGHLLIEDVFGSIIFGFFSALAFIVFTLDSEFHRRQADRASGRASHTTPRYGLARWISDHRTTALAQELAQVNPQLGLHGSLDAARAQLRQEAKQYEQAKRLAALKAILVQKARIDHYDNPTAADIDVNRFDLSYLAARLVERADHDQAIADIESYIKTNGNRVTMLSTPAEEATTVATTVKPKRATKTKATRSKTRTDEDLKALLAEVERDADGTVPVRRAARELKCGPDRARRLLTEAGLLKTASDT